MFRNDLTDTLTSIIFTASVQHHALSAPHHLYTYLPHRPSILYKWISAFHLKSYHIYSYYTHQERFHIKYFCFSAIYLIYSNVCRRYSTPNIQFVQLRWMPDERYVLNRTKQCLGRCGAGCAWKCKIKITGERHGNYPIKNPLFKHCKKVCKSGCRGAAIPQDFFYKSCRKEGGGIKDISWASVKTALPPMELTKVVLHFFHTMFWSIFLHCVQFIYQVMMTLARPSGCNLASLAVFKEGEGEREVIWAMPERKRSFLWDVYCLPLDLSSSFNSVLFTIFIYCSLLNIVHMFTHPGSGKAAERLGGDLIWDSEKGRRLHLPRSKQCWLQHRCVIFININIAALYWCLRGGVKKTPGILRSGGP